MNKKSGSPNQLRAVAEAQLAHAPKPKPKPIPAEELLHELQVYQIELEMQNEQLRQSQTALEESRDRYVDLYEFAPVGYLTLTDKGLIGEINLTGSSLLKVERNKLLRKRFSSFVAPEQLDRWNRLFVNMLQKEESQGLDLLLRNGGGEDFRAYLDCKHHAMHGKPEVRITLTDITRLSQAEQAMHEWQVFVEHASWGMTIGSLEERIIRQANPAYGRMHGYTNEELHGIKADAMYAPESRANLPYYVDCVRKDGRCSFECMRLRKDGSTFPAVVDISTVGGVDGKTTVMVSVKDITERKQAEKSLRESRQLLNSIVEHIPVMVFVKSAHDLRIELFNRAGEELLGYSRNDLLGKGNYDLWPKEQGDQFTAADRKVLASEGVLEIPEEPILTASGGTRYLQTWKIALRDDDGEPSHLLGISIDITERKRAEQQLRDLTSHLHTVREEEKASIAREIHDELGGTLTALKMEAYWLAEELPASKGTESLLKHVELISQLTENAARVTRRVITGLRPTILDDLGLLAALEWQAGQFRKLSGIPCRVNSIENKINPDRQYSIALFRIFQEALTNVAKHSGASRVAVEYCGGEEEIMLSVSDDGCGLPDGHTVAPTSYGVRGMCERVKQLGGSIKFDSPFGGGFCVTVILPQHADNRKEPTT